MTTIKVFILIFLLFVLDCIDVGRNAMILQEFAKFKQENGKVYSSKEEELKSFETFSKKWEIVERLEKKFPSFDIKVPESFDLEDEKIIFKKEESIEETKKKLLFQLRFKGASTNQQVPETLDYRKEGFVTDIKDQQYCGDCWMFAATAVVEGQYKYKTDKLETFSEQQILDCMSDAVKGDPQLDFFRIGCLGGNTVAYGAIMNVLKYLYIDNSYEDYSGFVYPKHCPTKNAARKNNAIKFKNIAGGYYPSKEGQEINVDIIKQILYENHGPIVLDMDFTLFQEHYEEKGVIMDQPAKCQNPKTLTIDHDVTLVGYGKKDDGTEYWIIKDSHGTGLGDGGYFYVKTGGNFCGLESEIYIVDYELDPWCEDENCNQCNEDNLKICTLCYEGYYLEEGKCKACSQNNCKSCDASTCTSCKDGYYLDNNSCVKCGDDHCKECSSTTCNQCNVGFFVETESCESCDTGCFDCSSKTQCVDCDMTHYLTKNNTCAKCPGTCKTCEGGDHYFQYDNKQCFSCNAECKACEGRHDYCIECQPPKILKDGRCERGNALVLSFYALLVFLLILF